MSSTNLLLKSVGSPFIRTREHPVHDRKEGRRLYLCATRNRMPLLYLHSLKHKGELEHGFEKTYRLMHQRYLRTFDAMLEASSTLQAADIGHALFKTIRPYVSTTVDIDILIFGNVEKYERSLVAFAEDGYRELGYGPNSTTFEALSLNVGIDLYREVSVSRIIYMDKDKLNYYVISRPITRNSLEIKTLSPAADLIAIIAHSVIKEQLYTISEYYSTLNFVSEMSRSEILDFVELAKENALVNAVRTHIGITASLHGIAHGDVPRKIRNIIDMVGINNLEVQRLKESNYKTPHRFHVLTVAKALSEKMKEDKARRSVVAQIANLMYPGFAKSLIDKVLDHIRRETY